MSMFRRGGRSEGDQSSGWQRSERGRRRKTDFDSVDPSALNEQIEGWVGEQRPKIGEILLELGSVDPDQLIEALQRQKDQPDDAQAKAVLALAEISAPDASFADAVRGLGVSDPLLDEGVAELTAVVETAAAHSPGLCVADLRIARGLDYYTGTVYETQMIGYERFGSVCSGGRYDNLASAGSARFPGVGISIGVTRLLGLLFGTGALSVSRDVPTSVLVAVTNEELRPISNRVAEALRSRGIPTEVSPSAAKFGKQIRYAERRGIPYVWFPGADGAADEVKDIRSGEQVVAAAGEWTPPREDLKPLVS